MGRKNYEVGIKIYRILKNKNKNKTKKNKKDIQNTIYKTDPQQGHTLCHREVYLILCINLYWRREWQTTSVFLP